MNQCNTCGNYYRLLQYHNNPEQCELCSRLNVLRFIDEDVEQDVKSLLNPTGKTLVHRYDE